MAYNKNLEVKKIKYPELTIQDVKIKVIISETLERQIRYLCDKISTLEWSGPLFYEVEGDIDDPENMVITCKEVLPLDKGTSTYTSFSTNEKLPMKWMEIGTDHKIGLIHSHNKMSSFFSGTDMDELHENAANHNFYLSLIVNNNLETVCKLCYLTDNKIIRKAKNKDGKNFETTHNSQTLIIYDCDVVFQRDLQPLSEDFINQFAEIMKTPEPVYTTYRGQNNIASTGYSKATKSTNNARNVDFYDGWDNEYYPVNQKVEATPITADDYADYNRIVTGDIFEVDVEYFLQELLSMVGTYTIGGVEDAITDIANMKISQVELENKLLENINSTYARNFSENVEPYSYKTKKAVFEFCLEILLDCDNFYPINSVESKYISYIQDFFMLMLDKLK